MTATPLTLDPEIQGLIQEIAATPNSTLLRKPRSDVFHSPYDRVRPTTPGLTTAERHLVRVHAEELAYWLRVACVMGLLSEAGDTDRAFSRHIDLNSSPVETPSQEDWAKCTRREVAHHEELSDNSEIADLLVRSSLTVLSIRHAAALSNRLAPSDEARSYLACSYMEAGEPHAALLRFRALESQTTSPITRGSCWINMGRALFSMGRYGEAKTAYKRGTRSGPLKVASFAGWLSSAILADDISEARAAAQAVDEYVPFDHPALEDYLRRNSPFPAATSTHVPRSMGSDKSASGRIVDALM